MVAASLGKSI